MLLRHPTAKEKVTHRCADAHGQNGITKARRSVQVYQVLLANYTHHGNWCIIPLLSCRRARWWVFNKEVEWVREIGGRVRERSPALAPVSIQLMGFPESWSMYTWASWGCLFIDEFSPPWRYVYCFLCKSVITHSSFL